MLSRDKRLPLDTWNQSGLRENVFGNQFSKFNSPGDHRQRIQSDALLRNREATPEVGRTKTIHTREDKFNADICNKTVDCDFHNAGGITDELHGGTAKTTNSGIAIRLSVLSRDNRLLP